MIENIDLSMVDWARAQFTLTAIYHWIFVPLTLGLTFIIAFMETMYVKTGNEEWKRITKFWMKLFGINFAIGVATGIIMEFEFGTNWSNYSWFVGDIFGAPLAIEGIMAFFLETTFVAIMFFGWNKVSKKFHLTATWLVAFGSNLSALWILTANAWMQSPVGMHFNPDTARSEMLNFWEVLLSPVAQNKFLHTIFSSYIIASMFVIAISSWFLLKKRNINLAKKSILIAAIFGLISTVISATTGDGSAKEIATAQPAKLAAMEGHYKGEKGTGLVAFGILNSKKEIGNNEDPFIFKIQIPKLLSLMSYGDGNAYIAGIEDLVNGDSANNIIAADQKIANGKMAIAALASYKEAKKAGNTVAADSVLKVFESNYKHLGYGYLKDKKDIIPPIAINFYSFHIMVLAGGFLLLFALIILYLSWKNKLEGKKFWLRLGIWSFPIAFIASVAGWIVAEVGRQPWAIQDLLPTAVATSNINVSSVKITFFIFAILFTTLLIAEVRIMLKAIKSESDQKGGQNV